MLLQTCAVNNYKVCAKQRQDFLIAKMAKLWRCRKSGRDTIPDNASKMNYLRA